MLTCLVEPSLTPFKGVLLSSFLVFILILLALLELSATVVDPLAVGIGRGLFSSAWPFVADESSALGGLGLGLFRDGPITAKT